MCRPKMSSPRILTSGAARPGRLSRTSCSRSIRASSEPQSFTSIKSFTNLVITTTPPGIPRGEPSLPESPGKPICVIYPQMSVATVNACVGNRSSMTPQPHLPLTCGPLSLLLSPSNGGSFAFRGREVRIAPNLAGDASPLHGTGWLAAWSVESAAQAEAVLGFRHAPGEWPWAFYAAQHFVLREDGLTV